MHPWALDPSVVHLNHGSFGGCLRSTLDAAERVRRRLEASPMRYFVRDWQRELDAARADVAAFVGADPTHLAFVASATTGVAIALASLAPTLAAGDEVLTTSHAYRACRNQLDRIADERGARIVVAAIALPFDADAAVAAIVAAATPRTVVALVDHITSPTALVLPIAAITRALAARGIAVVIDGAHAPGQVALDVGALIAAGATYYAGNLHKWLCAPKSAGFIVAAPAAAPRTRPVVTSHGASAGYGPANRFHAELDWAGTYDPAPMLAAPTAIADVAALAGAGGWSAAIARNHALALELRDRFVAALLPPRAHRDDYVLAADSAIGSMVAIPIALPAGGGDAFALQTALLDAGWEVPIIDTPATGGALVRLSAHLYNRADDADALARALAHRGGGLRRC